MPYVLGISAECVRRALFQKIKKKIWNDGRLPIPRLLGFSVERVSRALFYKTNDATGGVLTP